MRTTFSRRALLAASAGVVAGACRRFSPSPEEKRPPLRDSAVVLLRSGWQTENIGDIAHTPGVLRLLGRYVPEAKVILWSNALDRGVEEMLRRNFPGLRIVSGDPSDESVQKAFEEAEFFLHGSGPSLVARSHVAAWREKTGKPYGALGITVSSQEDAALLKDAAFVFTRETASLGNVRQAGLSGPSVAFAPDGTFSFALEDEEAGKAFLAKSGLKAKEFIAVVPRLRYTPYHKMRKVDWTAEEIERRTGVNEKRKEEDHAKLREAITAWVRETGHKALLCPEMTYQLDIVAPLLFDPLPADVKKQVVRRTAYWLPDEAASVYRRAAVVASFECHSPILAVVNDTPCLYVHQPEDGIKGQMWKDIGLPRWYFEVEETSGNEIAERLLDIHRNYPSAQVDAHEATLYARKLQGDAMMTVRRAALS
ncbi:MAG: polysaccharide pyruvyl transferase family protein [Bryobacteraceae bacterium]|nr:polysaccharide pyruvyl transferase family protein [Bryobacteraceae bacterium]